MSRMRPSVRGSLAVLITAFGLIACNVSDGGGGIDVDCLDDTECPNGRCANGICIDTSSNNDAGSNNPTTVDGGPTDMSGSDMSIDVGTVDMGGLDCPDGFIDFNGDPADGCETPTFPGWNDAACQACAGIPNAVAGCGGGATCTIAACVDGFYDRDGEIENGCESTCAPGECWQIVTAEHREIVFVAGPDFWFSTNTHGLIGRELAERDWTYSSLEGPRDFVASELSDLHVVDEVIVGNIRDKLVRSVDHGRTFGPHPKAPVGSLVDINEGADGRHYLLVADAECPEVSCTEAADCPGAEPACSTAEGICGTTSCAGDIDCPSGRRCTTDGVCVAQPAGCRYCGMSDACSDPVFQVYVTNDFETFMPLEPALPAGSSAQFVHGSVDGFPIVTQTSGAGSDDDLRMNPNTNEWEPIDGRNCALEFMVFLQSGDGVAIGDGCSFEYDAIDAKLNGRETIPGAPNSVLFHRDVIYVAGANFIAASTSFGSNYTERSVAGEVIHLYADGDEVVAVGSHGERWRSVDRGQSWNQEIEANQPFPRQVETGSPLAIMGLGQQGGIITPSPNGVDEPWIQIASQNVQRIKQAQGAALGFANNPPLFSGSDWQSLNPMNVNTQLVDTSQWPACSGRPCRIKNVVDVRDGTYDGSNMFVVAEVQLEFQISVLGWTDIQGTVTGILRSANGVSWDGVQYSLSTTPQNIIATDFGLVIDRGYSSDGRQWFTSGTPDCGAGPFFRGSNGDILGFGDQKVCRTNDGATWNLLSDTFWATDTTVTAERIYIRNGAFFVVVDADGITAVNASDDAASWRPVGPRWPGDTDIAFGNNTAAVAHPSFFGISN